MSENKPTQPATLWGRVYDFFTSLAARVAGIFPRLGDFALIAIALAVVILLFQPHLLTVTAYKLSLVTLAAWLGYRVDRSVFPYARPHKYYDLAKAESSEGEDKQAATLRRMGDQACLRRAIIVAAVILAIALGA